ncbi:MAG: hypothetical protein JW772_00550 [Candidatus Diapherotrites archaeon]|nr:hypothetical protein [Candidatus Diapherotrites archaeon]
MIGRAQSLPEYMMTYGLAIILTMVIIAAVLYVLTPQPRDDFYCYSNNPELFLLGEYDLPYSLNYVVENCRQENSLDCEAWGITSSGDPAGKMVLSNNSNKPIEIIDVKQFYDGYSPKKLFPCFYRKTFNPKYVNSQDSFYINENFPLTVPENGELQLSEIYLLLETTQEKCKVSDFAFPTEQSIVLVVREQDQAMHNVSIICKNFPGKEP